MMWTFTGRYGHTMDEKSDALYNVAVSPESIVS